MSNGDIFCLWLLVAELVALLRFMRKDEIGGGLIMTGVGVALLVGCLTAQHWAF